MHRIIAWIVLVGAQVLGLATSALAQPPAPSPAATTAPAAPAEAVSADEKAIRENAAAYAEAFNNRDAKAMAEVWAPDAVYTNRLTGAQAVGREAITKQIEALLKAAGKTKVEVKVEKVEFVSPSVAIERGTTRFIPAEGAPDESTYSAVEVKRDGKWLLDRVTEETTPPVAQARQKLQELAWLVGSWKEDPAQSQVETECSWTRNGNFLTLAFKASVVGRTQMAGIQVIGYDASKKQFRSWVFDSDGGFGEGLWQQKDKKWFIHQKGTLPDGRTSSAVNIIRKLDDNSYTWQSINREIDGRLEPNVDEIRMLRQKD